MRPEFRHLLEALEVASRETSQSVDARIAAFRYTGPMVLKSPEQCREVLVRFYWQVSYPEVSIDENWSELEEAMYAGMKHLLARDYGDKPWIQVCDQVIPAWPEDCGQSWRRWAAQSARNWSPGT